MEKLERQVPTRAFRSLLIVGVLLLLPRGAPAQGASGADAVAFEQEGKLEDAAQAWRAVTLRDPNDAAAFASLGVVLAKEQKYPEAATAYRQALTINPRLVGIQLNLGLAEFKQGRFAE